jgi:hypothetical protein
MPNNTAPPDQPTPNRQALELHLRPGEVRFVKEWCELQGVELTAWPEERRLACFVDVAIGRHTALLPYGSDRFLVRRAAEHFGLSFDALWMRRHRRQKECIANKPFAPIVDLEAERTASRKRRVEGGNIMSA